MDQYPDNLRRKYIRIAAIESGMPTTFLSESLSMLQAAGLHQLQYFFSMSEIFLIRSTLKMKNIQSYDRHTEANAHPTLAATLTTRNMVT